MSDNKTFNLKVYGNKVANTLGFLKVLFVIYGISAVICIAMASLFILDPHQLTVNIQSSSFFYAVYCVAVGFFVLFITSPIVLLCCCIYARHILKYALSDAALIGGDVASTSADALKATTRALLCFAVLSIGIPESAIGTHLFPSTYYFFVNVTVLMCIVELCMAATVPMFLRLFQHKIALFGEQNSEIAKNDRLKGIFVPANMTAYCMVVGFIGIMVVFIGFIFLDPTYEAYRSNFWFIDAWF